MKLTSKQVRKIIREEIPNLEAQGTKKIVREANPDGTISDNEDNERDLLMAEVEERLNEILDYIISESERIGGPFRRAGIKKQAFRLLADMIHSYR